MPVKFDYSSLTEEELAEVRRVHCLKLLEDHQDLIKLSKELVRLWEKENKTRKAIQIFLLIFIFIEAIIIGVLWI